MSIKYRDKNGAERVLSGLTPGGNLEAGAVATRKGQFTIPSGTLIAPYYKTEVTFDSPLPDGDYVLETNLLAIGANDSTKVDFAFNTKTAEGFACYALGLNGMTTTAAITIAYTAFKIYEVSYAEQNASDLAAIKSYLPNSVSASNQLATAKQVNDGDTALASSISEISDCVPNTASISNQLVTTSEMNTAISTATVVDSELDEDSENPVQNKVIKAEFDKVPLLQADTTYNGNPLSIETNCAQISKETIVSLGINQAGSGDPSPINVRTISGIKNFNLKNYRKNHFVLNNFVNATDVTYNVIDQNSLTVTATTASGWVYSRWYIENIEPETTYTLSFNSSSDSAYFIEIELMDASGNAISPNITVTTKPKTFTTYAGVAGLRLNFYTRRTNSGSVGDTITYSNIQLEYGEQATSYEPYNPVTNIDMDFPETVYNGTLNIESGELTITHKLITYNGSESWTKYSSYDNTVYIDKPSDCDRMKAAYSNMLVNGSVSLGTDHFSIGAYIFVRDDVNATSVANYKTYLASNNLQILYGLTTPIIYHLTPHQIQLLLGDNSVFTNAKSIKLTFNTGKSATMNSLIGLANSINALGWEKIGEVTANGTLTFGDVLNSLYTQAGRGFSPNYSYMLNRYKSGTSYRLQASNISSSRICFEYVIGAGSGIVSDSYYVTSVSKFYYGTYNSQSDKTSTKPNNGEVFTLYRKPMLM